MGKDFSEQAIEARRIQGDYGCSFEEAMVYLETPDQQVKAWVADRNKWRRRYHQMVKNVLRSGRKDWEDYIASKPTPTYSESSEDRPELYF